MKKYIVIGLAVLLFGSSYAVLQSYNNKNQLNKELTNETTNSTIQALNNNTPEPNTQEPVPAQTEDSAKLSTPSKIDGSATGAPPQAAFSSSKATPNTQNSLPETATTNNTTAVSSTTSDSVPTTPPIQAITSTPTPTSKPSSNAPLAKDFTLTDLNGNKVALSDFRGKNVFLNFWATWCPPCRGEMPDIEKIYQKYKDSVDLVILAVDIGENDAKVQSFISKSKYNFNVLLDSDQSVAMQYQINSIPTSYFLNTEGKIVAKQVGAMTEKQMENHIEMLIK